MKIELNNDQLFRAHQEFNQLKGMALSTIDMNLKNGNLNKGSTFENMFPVFSDLVNKINMQQYKIPSNKTGPGE